MWEQIQANKRRSVILITGMAMVLLVLGYVAGEGLIGSGGGLLGLLVALVIWGIQMGIYFTSAESVLLHNTFAKNLEREDSPQLFNVVEEMTLASGLGFMPRIYLIDDPAPNAFAIGRKPKDSAVAVTTGLMHRLNRDELQGVIAHEVAHLKNRDVQFLTLAAVMLGSIVILSEMAWRMMRYGGRRRSNSRGGGQAQLIFLAIGLLFAILGPIMAQMLYFACSRKREYLADACGAQFTRYPEGLASALEKISNAAMSPAFTSKALAPMFIMNPLHLNGSTSLFATHPPATERIHILRNMAGASLADYETAYQHAKGGPLIGAASLKGTQPQEIRISSGEGPIEPRRSVTHLTQRLNGYLPIQCGCGLRVSVPEQYEQNELRCIRCGSVLPIPAAQIMTPPVLPITHAEPPPIPQPDVSPLQYQRTGHGWESFRCACGHTISLSPIFALPRTTCQHCKQSIEIAPASE